MTTRICLVTTGHLSTNPRLVKEADALVDAGHDVHVVATKFWAWADAADASFEGRPWSVEWVRFGALAPGVRGLWRRLRQRAAREVVRGVGPRGAPASLLVRAVHYVTPDLARAAARYPADLYVAHNLGALPAAAGAARRNGARLGFDAEDFHRGELDDRPESEPVRALVSEVERRFVPECDYVTAASDGIAQAYASAVGIDRPTTVLNVFPLSDRSAEVDPDALAAEVPAGARSLHWFSQTIGPERGLEDVVRALPALPGDVVLSLRGGWAPGYEGALRGLAVELGVGNRVRHLGHCPPHEVVRRAAEHDVGLALEVGATRNRDLCVTNKIFTYLLAGLPTVATDTTGQRGVCAGLPEATRVYRPGDTDGLVRALTDILGAPDARRAAEAASRSYNWEQERSAFLRVAESALAEGGRSW